MTLVLVPAPVAPAQGPLESSTATVTSGCAQELRCHGQPNDPRPHHSHVHVDCPHPPPLPRPPARAPGIQPAALTELRVEPPAERLVATVQNFLRRCRRWCCGGSEREGPSDTLCWLCWVLHQPGSGGWAEGNKGARPSGENLCNFHWPLPAGTR